MKTASELGASPNRAWRTAVDATLAATWILMVLGALTRASLAGLACPDWPLCHGYLVPPLDEAAYPNVAGYEVYKVYLEYSHRVLAAVAGLGALVIGWKAWREGHPGLGLALVGVLALQIGMGAVTVWLGNAPLTVVLHLALALSFFTLLLAVRQRLAGEAPAPQRSRAFRVGYWLTAGLAAAQMLVGAAVSSRYLGLACPDWPLCEGQLWPAPLSFAVAWQLLHRGLGAVLLLSALWLAAASWLRPAGAPERRTALLFALGVMIQALVGALNVWLQIPPWASALHLGLGVAVFGLPVWRALGQLASPALPARDQEPLPAR